MPIDSDVLIPLAIFVPLGGLVGWLLARRGVFARSALALAPDRNVNLGLIDGGVAFLLYTAALWIMAGELRKWGYESPQAFASMPTATYARYAVLQHAVALPVVIYVLIRTGRQPNGWRELGLVPRAAGREIALGVKALVAALPLVMGINAITAALGELGGMRAPQISHDMLKRMVESPSFETTAALLLSAVVLAPLIEEFVFRGLVQTVLLREMAHRKDSGGNDPRAGATRWWIVFLAAAIFTTIHGGLPWQVMPGLFTLGTVLAWVYERSGSLLPGLVVHLGFNAINSAWVLVLVRHPPA